MSLKPIWKNRAIARANEPKVHDEVIDASFALPSLANIRKRLGEHLVARMPQMIDAVDDPTSNISALLDAVAATDLDLYKQIEAIADTFGGKTKK